MAQNRNNNIKMELPIIHDSKIDSIHQNHFTNDDILLSYDYTLNMTSNASDLDNLSCEDSYETCSSILSSDSLNTAIQASNFDICSSGNNGSLNSSIENDKNQNMKLETSDGVNIGYSNNLVNMNSTIKYDIYGNLVSTTHKENNTLLAFYQSQGTPDITAPGVQAIKEFLGTAVPIPPLQYQYILEKKKRDPNYSGYLRKKALEKIDFICNKNGDDCG